LSGLEAEMIQATGILELSRYCIYVTVLQKKVAFQGMGSQVWYYQFTMGKPTQWSVDLHHHHHHRERAPTGA